MHGDSLPRGGLATTCASEERHMCWSDGRPAERMMQTCVSGMKDGCMQSVKEGTMPRMKDECMQSVKEGARQADYADLRIRHEARVRGEILLLALAHSSACFSHSDT